MPLSKNQIRKVFEDIATKHWMIHSFSYGNEWEITETPKGEVRVNYPILFVEPLGNSYPFGKINHNYNIYILDITKKGESRATLESEMEVESDTFKICSDIVSLLNSQAVYPGFTLDRNLTRTDAIVYSEKDQDELTGHRLSVTLTEAFDANACAVAGEGFNGYFPSGIYPNLNLGQRISQSKSITVMDPVLTDNLPLFFTKNEIRIWQVNDVLSGTTPSITYNIYFGPEKDLAGTKLWTTDRTITDISGEQSTTFDNYTIPENSWIWVIPSAKSGTVSLFSTTIIFTE